MPSAVGKQNVAVIAYGLFCYGVALATLAYTGAFVGNYWAAFGWRSAWFKSLDTGTSASVGEAVLVDLSLIALFGLQHSVMARRSVKAWLVRFISPAIERSTYVLASSACLALLFWQWRPIGAVLWDASNGVLGVVLVGISLCGWLIVARASVLIDHAELFGLRQAFGKSDGPVSELEFKTPGLYRTVRHPLYFGLLVAFWSTPLMTAGHLLFAAGLTAYILVAIPLEERDLVARFGDGYRAYQKRVRALLPFPRAK